MIFVPIVKNFTGFMNVNVVMCVCEDFLALRMVTFFLIWNEYLLAILLGMGFI